MVNRKKEKESFEIFEKFRRRKKTDKFLITQREKERNSFSGRSQ